MNKTDNDTVASRLMVQTQRLKSEGFTGGIIWAALQTKDGVRLFLGEGAPIQANGQGLLTAAQELLSACPELGAVLFTTPEYCVKAAKTLKSIPPVLDDMAQIVGPRADILDGGDPARLVRKMKGRFACIVRESGQTPSGALSAGRSLDQAVTAALVLEKSARVYALASGLGGAKPLGKLDALLMHFVYTKKYSRISAAAAHRCASDAGREISAEELSLRQSMVDTCIALVEQNLVQGTWGNMSVRLDERYMLATPSGMDYDTLTPYDIVRVDMRTLEYEGGLKPTSEKGFHACIYLEHADVNCVIHAHSPYASVYAAAHAPLKGDAFEARVAGYGLPGTKTLKRNVCAAIKDNRACIMENHGLLVCGPSIEYAAALCRDVESAGVRFLKGN